MKRIPCGPRDQCLSGSISMQIRAIPGVSWHKAGAANGAGLMVILAAAMELDLLEVTGRMVKDDGRGRLEMLFLVMQKNGQT